MLDRSILFELERVAEGKRKELQEIYNCFEADRPYLLGAIFDILVSAMKIYPTVKLEKLTRMADFCRWGYAIAEAVGGYGDKFLQEYRSNQTIQNTEAINADAVAFLIVEFMRYRFDWMGRVSTLYKELRDEAEKHSINPNSKNVPQAPNNLSRRIKAVKSNLENVGITFQFDSKHSDGMYITLKNQALSPLSSYCADSSKILGAANSNSNGDNNGDRIIFNKLSSAQIPIDTTENGDGADNEDEYVEF